MAGTNSPTFGNGKICYVEIPAADVESASAFYKAVFGWSVRKRGDGATSFDDGVGQVSGAWVLGREAETSPSLMVHIMVLNIEATMDLITANGGKIVQPVGADLPAITARFSDPYGNVMGLYQHEGN
ncbi:MAG TPA: VOC family protein [Blastocatellia bacterium]|nr:VOC family protein [Blastocatellia bacterium]